MVSNSQASRLAFRIGPASVAPGLAFPDADVVTLTDVLVVVVGLSPELAPNDGIVPVRHKTTPVAATAVTARAAPTITGVLPDEELAARRLPRRDGWVVRSGMTWGPVPDDTR